MSKKATAVDLGRIARDPAYFVEGVCGWHKLHEVQKAFLTDNARRKVFAGFRGAGKTDLAMFYAAWRCIVEPHHVVVYVGGRAGHAEYAGGSVLQTLLTGSPVWGWIKSWSAERVQFKNGSTIHLLPHTEVAVRGFHGQYSGHLERTPSVTLILDESGTIGDSVYNAAMGVLSTAPDGLLLITGSPRGKSTFFWREASNAMQGVGGAKYYHLAAEDVAWSDKAFIEQQRENMPADEFRMEFGAEFVATVSAFLNHDDVQRCVREDVEIPGALDPTLDYEFVLGMDMSRSERWGSDFSALVMVARCYGNGLRAAHEARATEFVEVNGERMRMQDGYVMGVASKRRAFAEALAHDPGPHVVVCDVRRFQSLGHYELIEQVKELKGMYPQCDRVICDSLESLQMDAIFSSIRRRNEVGETRTRYGRGPIDMQCEIVEMTAPFKHKAYSHLHQTVRDGMLWLPAHGRTDEDEKAARELIVELLHLDKTVSDSGRHIKIHASGGHKDDLADALTLALWETRREKQYAGQVWAV